MIFLIDVIYVMIDYCHRHNQINQRCLSSYSYSFENSQTRKYQPVLNYDFFD